MTAAAHSAEFLAMCKAAGVNPGDLPDRPGFQQMALGPLVGRVGPRRRPRSPDREASVARRRTLGGSSSIPPQFRHYFTEAERAALTIVVGEVKRPGYCDFPLDKIAALAGVCRTSVQNALRAARAHGLLTVTARPRPGQSRRNFTNLIVIVSSAWLGWLKRAPAPDRPIPFKPVNSLSPTKSKSFNHLSFAPAERSQGARREELWPKRQREVPISYGLPRAKGGYR
jgi:hypothetical protein